MSLVEDFNLDDYLLVLNNFLDAHLYYMGDLLIEHALNEPSDIMSEDNILEISSMMRLKKVLYRHEVRKTVSLARMNKIANLIVSAFKDLIHCIEYDDTEGYNANIFCYPDMLGNLIGWKFYGLLFDSLLVGAEVIELEVQHDEHAIVQYNEISISTQ